MLRVEFDREDDGRWIAEVPALPGCMAYGRTRPEAIRRVKRLADEFVGWLRAEGRAVPNDPPVALAVKIA